MKVNTLLSIIFDYRINNEIENSSFKLCSYDDTDDEDNYIDKTINQDVGSPGKIDKNRKSKL